MNRARRFRLPAVLGATGLLLTFGSAAVLLSEHGEAAAAPITGEHNVAPTNEELEEALKVLRQNNLNATFLSAGTAQAASGAGQLSDGARQLAGGLSQARDGSGQLADGSAELASGIAHADDGAQQLSAGWAEFSGGITQLGDGASQVSAGVNELVTSLQPLEGAAQFSPHIADALAQLEQLRSGAAELAFQLDNPGSDFRTGAAQLHDGSNQLSAGTSQLRSGGFQVRDGAIELRDGLVLLTDGSGQLVTGTDQLADGAGKIEATASRLTGSVNDVVNKIPRSHGQSVDNTSTEIILAESGDELTPATAAALVGLGVGATVLITSGALALTRRKGSPA